MGFIGGNVDPCLCVKESAKGIIHVALYVNDNPIVGNVEAIDDAIAALKESGLVLKSWMGYRMKYPVK